MEWSTRRKYEYYVFEDGGVWRWVGRLSMNHSVGLSGECSSRSGAFNTVHQRMSSLSHHSYSSNIQPWVWVRCEPRRNGCGWWKVWKMPIGDGSACGYVTGTSESCESKVGSKRIQYLREFREYYRYLGSLKLRF